MLILLALVRVDILQLLQLAILVVQLNTLDHLRVLIDVLRQVLAQIATPVRPPATTGASEHVIIAHLLSI